MQHVSARKKSFTFVEIVIAVVILASLDALVAPPGLELPQTI